MSVSSRRRTIAGLLPHVEGEILSIVDLLVEMLQCPRNDASILITLGGSCHGVCLSRACLSVAHDSSYEFNRFFSVTFSR